MDDNLTNTNYTHSRRDSKKSHSIFSLTSRHSYNSIDGFNIRNKQVNVLDLLKEQPRHQPFHKNLLIDHPFPLIQMVSKRKILNNSNRLIRDLIRCNQRNLMKADEKGITRKYLLQSQEDNPFDFIEDAIIIKNNQNNNNTMMSNKGTSQSSFMRTGSENHYSLTALKRMDNIKEAAIINRNYRKNHDSNLFNKENLFKDPTENFTRNAYKMKKLYMDERFINKIKTDVSTQRYNNKLKMCLDLII